MLFLGFTFFILLSFISACAPTTPAITSAPVRIQYSFAARPWLVKAQGCAGSAALATDMMAADLQDVQAADLVIRLGQPAARARPAYQIGTDDLLVIVNPQNPEQTLTAAQVSGLFRGRLASWKSVNGPDIPVQVWVFPPGEDVEQIFAQATLNGGPVTSNARLANSPEEMLQAVGKDAGAIGLITRSLLTTEVSPAYTAAAGAPVLVITRANPGESLANMVACLQK